MTEPDYPRPIATVDVVLLTLQEGALAVLLQARRHEPEQGRLALPGGFIHTDSDADAEAAARRILRAKAGLSPRHLEQLYTFSGTGRDARGWSLSIAFLAVMPAEALRDTPQGEILRVDALPPLPFDHAAIVARAVERVRAKSTYSSLPAFLLPDLFTMAELHEVYQQVLGMRLDRASFRRKIEDQGVLQPVAGAQRKGVHRPAQLYRLAEPDLMLLSAPLAASPTATGSG